MLAASGSPAKTTYGETRAILKEKPADDDGGGKSRDPADDDRESSSGSDFSWSAAGEGRNSGTKFRLKPGARGIGTCSAVEVSPSSMSEVLGLAYGLPIWYGLCAGAYELAAGPVHLAIGNRDSDDDRVDRLRYGLGFHVGWGWLAMTSSGPATGGHFEAVGPLMDVGLGSLDFRLRGEATLSPQSMDIDYERYVFSDSIRVGVEHDRMDGYSRWAFPLTAELLWHPGTHGFYLGAGAGVTLLRETVNIHRRSPLGSGSFTGERDSWLPSTALSIGRESLGRHGKPNWYFEIRWQTLLLKPERRSSFPSDNALDAHGVGWVWGWYL